MCGICGVTTKERERVEKMNGALAHRGPDGEGVYASDEVTLGHRRLSIIDLDERASQPMQSADERYVITYNGELYNYRELKKELAGYPFRTESDTEVLLAAYAQWGEGMFPKLRGIFAFGIWDKKEKTLLLARDHMGVKPLYYSYENKVLTFASELSVFAQTHNELDRESVSLYMALEYVPAPRTMLKGVSKLPPGHMLKYRNGDIGVKEYFDTFTGDTVSPEGGIYETIDTAVARQLVSDRPVGVFLSGGLDSSIVLHHMSMHANSVRSFSVDFEMVPSAQDAAARFNADAELAKRTAEHYGAHHRTYSISLEHVRNNLLEAARSLDEPVANATGVTQYLLSKWVREDGVVVALGGDGGDELFGGYTRHRAVMAAHLYQKLPRMVQKIGARIHPKAAKLSIPLGASLHVELVTADDTVRDQITKTKLSSKHSAEDFFAELYKKAPKTMNSFDVFMRIDRRTWLPEESLLRSDRSSMAHGLELRVPLLDIDVVRMADAISAYKKTTPWQGKRVLRAAYRSHLPQYLFDQPKRGWLSPAAKWFRDEQINAQLQDIFSNNYYDGLGSLFDWDEVQKLLHEHTHFKGYHLNPLWNILVLQCWTESNKVKFT